MLFEKIKVYAFVGPSGTGKSYRAQMVASEKGIHFIIDDGLLIMDNEIVAGLSAKKAPTKIETVKHALFYENEERNTKYAFIYDKDSPEDIIVMKYKDDGSIEEVTDEEELDEASDVLEAYNDDPLFQGIK